MPLGDEKHKLIYDELVNILGSGYVSDDPAVARAYSWDFYAVEPYVANFHLTMAKIKKILDPNNIANTARLIDMER